MVSVETNLFLSFKSRKLYKDKCRVCGDHNMLCEEKPNNNNDPEIFVVFTFVDQHWTILWTAPPKSKTVSTMEIYANSRNSWEKFHVQ